MADEARYFAQYDHIRHRFSLLSTSYLLPLTFLFALVLDVRHGFVAVSIDYRLAAHSFLPELAGESLIHPYTHIDVFVRPLDNNLRQVCCCDSDP